MSLLSVKDLRVQFRVNDGHVYAVNGVSFDIEPGQKLAIVGESGSGKSQIAFSIMGLLAKNGEATGEVNFEGRNLLSLSNAQMNKLRAKDIGIIFQDPMASLNPYMRVSRQMSEILELHEGLSRKDALKRSIDMLEAVQIPDAKNRIKNYPHEFSGGMRQRIVIAMALLCRPKLILADEPTTALDVTVQAQIMRLLEDIQKEFGSAVALITHDLGVVAGFCEDAMVVYGGRVMEKAPVSQLFENPTHPYTKGLLAAVPNPEKMDEDLKAIPGSPPNMTKPLASCPFAPRCEFAIDACRAALPEISGEAPYRACVRPVEEIQ